MRRWLPLIVACGIVVALGWSALRQGHAAGRRDLVTFDDERFLQREQVDAFTQEKCGRSVSG